jgi:hypothetical protein
MKNRAMYLLYPLLFAEDSGKHYVLRKCPTEINEPAAQSMTATS